MTEVAPQGTEEEPQRSILMRWATWPHPCRGFDPWSPDIPDVDSKCVDSRHLRCFRCGGRGPQRAEVLRVGFPRLSGSRAPPHHHLLNKQTVRRFCELVSERGQTLVEEGPSGVSTHSLIDSFTLMSYLPFPFPPEKGLPQGW